MTHDLPKNVNAPTPAGLRAISAIETLGALERIAEYSQRELRRLSPQSSHLADRLRAAISEEIAERLSKALKVGRRPAG